MILIWHVPDKIFNDRNCGDNCARWLLEMGRKRDVTINLRHLLDFGGDPLEIKILNTGTIVYSMSELVSIAGYYV